MFSLWTAPPDAERSNRQVSSFVRSLRLSSTGHVRWKWSTARKIWPLVSHLRIRSPSGRNFWRMDPTGKLHLQRGRSISSDIETIFTLLSTRWISLVSNKNVFPTVPIAPFYTALSSTLSINSFPPTSQIVWSKTHPSSSSSSSFRLSTKQNLD